MKKLLFSLVFVLALLIIGCQENSITNPADNPAGSNKNSGTTVSNSIELSQRLDNPYPVFNSYIDLQGVVSYQMTVYQLDPIPPNAQESIALQLYIDANLTDICTVCEPLVNNTSAGVISDQTSDVLQVIEGQAYILVKTFAIQDRDDNMVLKVKFLVNPGEVTVDAIWLELDDSIASSDNRQS